MSIFKKMTTSGLVWLWIALVTLGVDRFTKFWVVNHLIYFEPLKILPIFNLTLAYNTGAAFSFLHNASGWQNWFLGGIAVAISLYMVFWLAKLPAKAYAMCVALNLILAGAIGNVIDRALYGYVIDFLSFHWGDWHFAIFNIADAAICIGAFILIVKWFENSSAK